MESVSLDSDESSHCRGTQLSSSPSLSSSSSLSSDSSGSGSCVGCGRQHDSDHWLATSHDPVVMGGLSRRGDAPDKPGSSHEGNMLTQAIHIWWKANERFLHCLPLRRHHIQ